MDWQSIETAPKDGLEVLVYTPHEGVVSSSYKHGCWQKLCVIHGTRLQPNNPTHWMPLPNPPKETP